MAQYYEIRIKGHLDLSWSEWFDGMTIVHQDDGETLVSGMLVDQAALHGILRKVSDLGVPLVSVNAVVDSKRNGQENADETTA
jgi:hypothetical protein